MSDNVFRHIRLPRGLGGLKNPPLADPFFVHDDRSMPFKGFYLEKSLAGPLLVRCQAVARTCNINSSLNYLLTVRSSNKRIQKKIEDSEERAILWNRWKFNERYRAVKL